MGMVASVSYSLGCLVIDEVSETKNLSKCINLYHLTSWNMANANDTDVSRYKRA